MLGEMIITQYNTVFCILSLLAASGHWEYQLKPTVMWPHLLPSFWLLSNPLYPELKGKGGTKGPNAHLCGLVTCAAIMKFLSWSGKGTPHQWHCWLGEKGERHLRWSRHLSSAQFPCHHNEEDSLTGESPPIEDHLLTTVTPACLLGNLNHLLNNRGRKV